MADKYRASDEFYNSLSEEQKVLFNKEQENVEKYVSSKTEKEVQSKLEAEKQTAQIEAQEIAKRESTKNDFLNSIPADNRKVVSDLLDMGKTPEQIKADYSNLTTEKAQPMPDINSIIEGKLSERDKENLLASENSFRQQVKEHGLPINPRTKDEIAQWERAEKLGLLKH